MMKIIQKKNILFCVVWPPRGSMVKEKQSSAKRIVKADHLWQTNPSPEFEDGRWLWLWYVRFYVCEI
jgi:hypothetical protein